MPLWLFPSLSSGGERHIRPMTLGTTRRMAPDTADLAGRPTLGTKLKLRMSQRCPKFGLIVYPK